MDKTPVFIDTIDTFVLLSWVLTICSSVWLGEVFRRNRFLFVKPSILVLLWSNLFFQWPASVYAGYYESRLPDPYALALLLHGFVLIGLLVSTHTFHRSAELVYQRLSGPQPNSLLSPTLLLAAYCAVVTAVYLKVVPFRSTGFYVILTHPALAALAREDSLKLITNAPMRYAYQTMVNAAALLLAVNLTILGSRYVRARRLIPSLAVSIGFCFLVFAVSLPGNRGSVVKLLLTIAVAVLFRRGLPFRPLAIPLGVAAILTPAVLITVLREGKTLSGELFLTYLINGVFSRVFVVPVNVGAFYIHYAQVHGSLGIAGVSRLATLLGVEPIRAANLIGNLYSYSGIESVSANAGFLFTYYGYFGLVALPLSLVGLWLLDVAIPIYLSLDARLFLPTVAAASVASIAFISSEYTTVLVTHGFAVILLLALFISAFLRPRKRRYHLGDSVSRLVPL